MTLLKLEPCANHPFSSSYHHHPLGKVVSHLINTLDMANAQSNPYAPMLGTIRDLPANPVAVERILDIIYMQLQLLMSATSTLTRTHYTTPTQTTTVLTPGMETHLESPTPLCTTCHPNPTSLGPSPLQSPIRIQPSENWHEQAHPSTVKGTATEVGPPHLTTRAPPTSHPANPKPYQTGSPKAAL